MPYHQILIVEGLHPGETIAKVHAFLVKPTVVVVETNPAIQDCRS